MITVFYHKKKISFANSFDELTKDQWIGIADVLYNGGDELQCRVKALKILLGYNHFQFLLLDPWLIDRSIEFLDWIFDDSPFTKQLLPEYRNRFGPTSNFDNLKMKEFHLSELFYKQILTPDLNEGSNWDPQRILDNLVAAIYRPAKKKYDRKKDPAGDIRQPFNHNEIDYHAKKISRWPGAIKHAIFIWYDSCRQQLIADNPLVFKEHTPEFISQFDTGLYGMMRSLAGEKLGTVEHIEDMYVHTAMLELGLLIEEEKHITEKLKKKS